MRWAGPRVGGKRSAGERMKAESAVSHGRSWPPSLAYSLTGPPALHPPAGSHRLHRRRSPALIATPVCPRLLSHAAESRPARRAHERPSVARQPAVPRARAQPPGRKESGSARPGTRAAEIRGERCSEHMAACAGLMGRVVVKDPRNLRRRKNREDGRDWRDQGSLGTGETGATGTTGVLEL